MPIEYLGDNWDEIAGEWEEGFGGIPPWIAEALDRTGIEPDDLPYHDIRIVSDGDEDARWIEVDGIEVTPHLPFDDDADIWSFYDWYVFIFDEDLDIHSPGGGEE